MKSWIKWVSYFLIFSFLIVGMRTCEQEENIGEVSYGFPFVYMDSNYGDWSFNTPEGFGITGFKIVNFYSTNLYLNLAFWAIIFGVFYYIRDIQIVRKYNNEISYGLFFVILFVVSFFFMGAFDNLSIGFVSIPGEYILIYTGAPLQDWIDKTPAVSHIVYETLKTFYPYKDDLPSRFGFISAALVYFLFGAIIYRMKLQDIRKI